MFGTSMSAYHNLEVYSASKGLVVRQLRWYVSWVQSVVIQFGPYLLVNFKVGTPLYERNGLF
jgi:hypothetical protein